MPPLRVSFTLVPDLFELSLDRVTIHALNGLPLITTQDSGIRGPNAAIKRSFDLLAVGGAMVFLAVPMLIIAALIRLDSSGPALYGQRRVGERAAVHLLQIPVDAPQRARGVRHPGHQQHLYRRPGRLQDEERPARDAGRALAAAHQPRRVAELLNVLRGEMSLVGPRPHVPEEVAKYEPWHRQRLTLVPGLTCLWQVNGRSDLTFDEQVRFDLYYGERWSLWLDIKILLWTVPAVLTRRGAY